MATKVDALTRPITAEETASALKASHGDLRDDVFFGTLEEVNAYFTEMKWTDGLPIILIGASRRPLSERAFANYYANPGGAKDGGEHNIRQYMGYLRRTEGATMTIKPEWYDSPDATIETIPTMQRGMTQLLITGDAARNKVQTMPGGGYSTVKIELPHNWDELMSERGYQPLYEYKVRSEVLEVE